MIDKILEEIAANNRVGFDGYNQGVLDGRVEAYERVLVLLGFYDEDRVAKYKRVPEEPEAIAAEKWTGRVIINDVAWPAVDWITKNRPDLNPNSVMLIATQYKSSVARLRGLVLEKNDVMWMSSADDGKHRDTAIRNLQLCFRPRKGRRP